MLPLLAGDSAQNLLTRSEELNHGDWTKTNVTVLADNAAGPFGAVTAEKVTFSARFARPYQDFTVTSGRIYTLSCWIKHVDGNTALQIRRQGGGAQSATNITVTSAWARYSHTFTATASNAAQLHCPQDRNAAGQGSVLVWGAQLNLGSVPGVYVKTGATNVP